MLIAISVWLKKLDDTSALRSPSVSDLFFHVNVKFQLR